MAPSVRLYSAEIADQILEQLTDGKGLLEICRGLGISDGAVRKWVMNDHEGFAARYALARQLGYEHMADEIIDIADDGTFDKIEVDGKMGTNHEAINRSRLKVDTRKWMLAKVLPKIYGDKVGIEHSGSIDTGLADRLEAARARKK